MLRAAVTTLLSGLSLCLAIASVSLVVNQQAACGSVSSASAHRTPLAVLCSLGGATTIVARFFAAAAFTAFVSIRSNSGLPTVVESLWSPAESLAPTNTGHFLSDRLARYSALAALAALVAVDPTSSHASLGLSLLLGSIFVCGMLVREATRDRAVRAEEEARLWSDDAIRARELAAHAGLASGSLMTAENELADEHTFLDHGMLAKGVGFVLAFYGLLATVSVPAFARFFFTSSIAAEPIFRFATPVSTLVRFFGAACLLAAGHMTTIDSLTFSRRHAYLLREVATAWLALHAADLLLLHAPHQTIQLSWNVIFIAWWAFVGTAAHRFLHES